MADSVRYVSCLGYTVKSSIECECHIP